VSEREEQQVRLAGSADRAAVVETRVSAFAGYGLTEWVVLADAERERRMRRWFELFFDLSVPHGMIFTDEAHEGAALWFPPGGFALSPLHRLRQLPTLAAVSGLRRLPSRLRGLLRLVDDHPDEPHYYLEAIGTVAGARGRGVGSALLDAGLARCDRDRAPAFLHTSNPAAVPFYQRRGFRERKPLVLPGDLVVRPMWREPEESRCLG
jgi:ribosomal protein S18 acetylase RimI-like enzyme